MKMPIRTIEVAAVEPIGGSPFARVTLVTSIEGARYLAGFMSDAEKFARWAELQPAEAPEPALLPDVDIDVNDHDDIDDE